MAITAQDVKRLREATGVGIMDAKQALEASSGDFDKAVEALRKSGAAKAAKKADRAANEGMVFSYLHPDGQIGVLVELNSETDFVARNDQFQQLGKDIAMQVAAMEPETLDELLAQPFIKDEGKTIGDLVKESIQIIGENIQIARFARFAIKGSPSCSIDLRME